MVSDVPLGAFLSAGIHSSAMVRFMATATGEPVKICFVGFDTGAAGDGTTSCRGRAAWPIATFLVAEFARREVTAIMSGVGGDELFGALENAFARSRPVTR
jgi:asparagine synthase (glutamine-hydrolysing)